MPSKEAQACVPAPLKASGFNATAQIPHGLNISHLRQAMQQFLDFLEFINLQLNSKSIERLESFLMPANFSSIVSEFLCSAIPKHCKSIARNRYHNGHPDLIPINQYPGNSVQHGSAGIEIKASRYKRGWQGHNAEDSWVLVFVFDCNSSAEAASDAVPIPFQFNKVVGAQLEQSDWTISGRSATSRRTPTASIARSGFDKMEANWIYRA